MAVSATADGDMMYLKIVNPTQTAVAATVDLNGVAVAPEAERVLLGGDRDATNTREHPDAVSPQTSTLSVGGRFEVSVPAMSVQVLRLKLK